MVLIVYEKAGAEVAPRHFLLLIVDLLFDEGYVLRQLYR